jgi:uncharacterized protein involved in exopolysaccharide biosynthesis
MRKSTSYRETFRQHRVLLSAPIVLAGLIAGLLVFTSRPSYVSTASLWVDNPPGQASSVGSAAATQPASSPASQEQQVVTELLATRLVKVAIGKRLGEDFTQIQAALTMLTTSTPGPQVLQFSFTGATPAAATTTLSAAMTELQQASAQFIDQRADDAMSYANAQVQQAKQSQSPSGFSVRVIDPPTPPYTSGKGKKKQLEGLLGGLLADALISLLGTIALTRGKPDPWDDELAKGSTAAGDGTPLDHRSVGTDASDGELATSAHGNGLTDTAGGGSAEGKVGTRHRLPAFTNSRFIADSSDRGSNGGPS